MQLKDMGATGDCHRECRTIARACDNVFNDHDTDIAEALYKVLCPGPHNPQGCHAMGSRQGIS